MTPPRRRALKRNAPAAAAAEHEPAQIDRQLAGLAARALAGERVECAWELFRLHYFPGWKPARVAGAVAGWSGRQAIHVAFETRNMNGVDTIFMVFTAREAAPQDRCSGSLTSPSASAREPS